MQVSFIICHKRNVSLLLHVQGLLAWNWTANCSVITTISYWLDLEYSVNIASIWFVHHIALCGDSACRRRGTRRGFVMVKDVPEGQKAPQQQQLTEQWDQHQKQSTSTQMHFILTLNPLPACGLNCVLTPFVQSVDSSLGGLSRSSTVASLDTDSTKSSGQCPLPPLPFWVFSFFVSVPPPIPHWRQQHVWNMRWVPRQVCGSHREVAVQHEQDPAGASGAHHLHRCRSGEKRQEKTCFCVGITFVVLLLCLFTPFFTGAAPTGTQISLWDLPERINQVSYLPTFLPIYQPKKHAKLAFVTQQDGKLPFVPEDKEMVLGVSKYGVKVASLDQCVS